MGVKRVIIGRCEDGDSEGESQKIVSKALLKVAGKGDRCTIDAVCLWLTHECSSVRWVALDALYEISSKGDEAVIVAVLPLRNDEDEWVRIAADETLKELMEAKDERLLELQDSCTPATPFRKCGHALTVNRADHSGFQCDVCSGRIAS